MLKYCVAALCLLAVCEASVISQAKVSRKIYNPFGIVEGIVPCPSSGTVLQVRVTECTTVPCRLVLGSTYIIEFDFRPSLSHAGLNIMATLINNGAEYVVIDGSVPGSAVEAGLSYTLTYPIEADSFRFFPGLNDLRIEITGQANAVIELCGIAGINVIQP